MYLPINEKEMLERGWDRVDFAFVTGDAYVDHPSFGTAVISRVLEAEGFRIGIISQPDWKTTDDFKRFGRPRLGFLVNSGNIDSMVAHYTVSKKKRTNDYYSPGGVAGKRPDRAVIVYCNKIREAYGNIPIIIGGIEASTRRFAHYDYWSDKIRRSILIDSSADILSYGMGENCLKRIAFLLDKGADIKKIRDVKGTCFFIRKEELDKIKGEYVLCGDYDEIKRDKSAYVRSFKTQYDNQDHVIGMTVLEEYPDGYLVQNPPMPPLTRKELDAVYSLPYERNYHPSYEKEGGVPAIEEVRFSITHNRGCFGGCNFCALAYHQGRSVVSRSVDSVLEEAEKITKLDGFKGYIHDVGGPTANFRYASCDKQKKHGMCKNKHCLAPDMCKNVNCDHTEYVDMLSKIEQIPGIKKVFVRSGIRFDYMLAEKNGKFFKKLVADHVSGQLKVAPEHCSDNVLKYMGKPPFSVYEQFSKKFYETTAKLGKEQYLVPYLMSSHPGSTLSDALELALYLKKNKLNPEQVQDFYPTPGTMSTCMFYTGIDPATGNKVYVPKSYEEKKEQRALLQCYKPENREAVIKALSKLGRRDLIPVLLPSGGKIIQKERPRVKDNNAKRTRPKVNKNEGKKKR